MLKTTFWKNAANTLPAEIRGRYLLDIEQAERWELGIDAVVEAWARAKDAVSRTFHTPRQAH
jgi:hypothetical protein